MADLSAKDGSQETLVNLLALCVNLVLLPLLSDTPLLSFSLFIMLAALHIYSNYRAVSCLVITSLNSARLHILLEHYKHQHSVQTPAQVNHQEPVMRPAVSGAVDIVVGESVNNVKKTDMKQVESMINNEEPYCILSRETKHHILLSSVATPRDVYRAYIQCYLGRDQVDSVLDEMEESGWDLNTLALNTMGFSIELDH